MAHNFSNNVFNPITGSLIHTSCINCGVVVGQTDLQPCPLPATVNQSGIGYFL
jgi:hypothetical protein